MNIAVTIPAGHVGSSVADYLLDIGESLQIKLLCRRPEKVQGLVRRGAKSAVGSQDDPEFLWATPPGYGSDNIREFQNRLGKAAATAIRTNQIPRVVNLSSLGANQSSGVGPISGLHDVEELLNEVAINVTHLRPGFFFENLLWQIDTIRQWGRISLPLSGSKSYPMIATRDIGRVAANRLADSNWTGRSVQELHGPADLTFKEVVEILSRVLERKIVYIRSNGQDARENMIQNALTENAADLMLELYEAAESGRLSPTQPRSEQTTTPTTFEEFARETILPLVLHPVVSSKEAWQEHFSSRSHAEGVGPGWFSTMNSLM
jgi:uncharacterized protein YbjT (DUF2867 family)